MDGKLQLVPRWPVRSRCRRDNCDRDEDHDQDEEEQDQTASHGTLLRRDVTSLNSAR